MLTTYILLGFSHENIVSRIVSPDVGLKKKKKLDFILSYISLHK